MSAESNDTKGMKKSEIAAQVFMKHLDKVGTMPNKDFRRQVMDEIQEKANCPVSSAAAMYNQVKNILEVTGDLEPGTLGRKKKSSRVNYGSILNKTKDESGNQEEA